MSAAATMLAALAIDAIVGWPAAVFALLGHPVTWIGALISTLDRSCNREGAAAIVRRAAGVLVALAVIGGATAAGWLVSRWLPPGWVGVLLAGLLAWPLIAARSMHDHVIAVARPLSVGELDVARQAVAMIVGRDTSSLDQSGISRAAIESLAENTSDGIVAPVFWGALFGLPGIAAYKAINTLDSMIGHRTPRHHSFGWAAARIDDVANLVPARMTGCLFAIVSLRPRVAFMTMLRYARQHRSPNAGWPEAAMAGALGVRLSGPRAYDGRMSDEPWVNGAGSEPGHGDLTLALALYRRALIVMAIMLALVALA
jgi:adenosylcobinamide-phosphate synthase